MNKFGLVVFDFDGTICLSADVKTEAFYRLYLDEMGDDFAIRVRDYHLRHVGVSRFDKIRHIEETMIGRPCSEARLQEIGARFGAMVEDAVVATSLVEGAAGFLEARPTGMITAVASATPTEELRRIVERRRISHWFDAVEGSPTSKARIVSGYLGLFGFPAERALMVGDQISDQRAALEAGVAFLGVATDPTVDFGRETQVVADLRPLGDYVRVPA